MNEILNFGERTLSHSGDIKTIKNTSDISGFPAITNRIFKVLNFGERTLSHSGDIKTIKNTSDSSGFQAITNREFKEEKDYIIFNSTPGASDIVFNHLVALFGAIPKKEIDANNSNFCTLTIIPTGKYNKNTFIDNINQAIGFGYTVVEQDSPIRSWKIYYMSIGNNTYVATYSDTYRRITVSSQT